MAEVRKMAAWLIPGAIQSPRHFACGSTRSMARESAAAQISSSASHRFERRQAKTFVQRRRDEHRGSATKAGGGPHSQDAAAPPGVTRTALSQLGSAEFRPK